MKSSIAVVGLMLLLVGCGGRGPMAGPAAASIAQISGPWEFVAHSFQQTGYSTLIETNLQESGGTLNANGASQIVLVGVHPTGGLYFGGLCPGNGVDALTGSISKANVVSLTLTEGSTAYTFTGSLTGTTTAISGTYAYSSGDCEDNGTFTAQKANALTGTYSGTLILPSGTDAATVTLTETPLSFSVSIALTGANNETDTLTGEVVANVFLVQGTVAGESVSYYGYYDVLENSLYLVNALNGDALGILHVSG
jgi:hypothetical protein